MSDSAGKEYIDDLREQVEMAVPEARASVLRASIPEIEAKVAKLTDYVASLPDGEDVAWLRIEAETSIVMDVKGKEYFRRACQRNKREYIPVRDVGVRLSSPENAILVMKGRTIRVKNAVLRADKARSNLVAQHFDQMSPADQQKFTSLGGLFGAFRTFAKEGLTKLIKG